MLVDVLETAWQAALYAFDHISWQVPAPLTAACSNNVPLVLPGLPLITKP